MNKIRRPAAAAAALALALTLGIPARAAETVTNETNHDYNAYRIFEGTQAENDSEGSLAVTGWGEGIQGSAFLAALKAGDGVFSGVASAAEAAEALAAHPDRADAFAALARQYITGDPVRIAAGAAGVELSSGYWLLVDAADVTGVNDAKNASLLQVTRRGAVTIAKKYGVPSVEKKVGNVSGPAGSVPPGGWLDWADYGTGDTVPFRITGTLPSNLDAYGSYFYRFSDVLSEGLTYSGDAKVWLVSGGSRTEITKRFDLTLAPGGIMQWQCDDIRAVEGVTKDCEIVVEYTAVLNEKAVAGGAGNPNAVSLEFSNNPDAGGGGDHGKTPDDTVVVFTYRVVVTKTDSQGAALKGAEFTLFKKTAGGTEKPIAAVRNPEGTVFTFAGLDAGSYVLRETAAPAGFNRSADIEFTVTARPDVAGPDPVLVELAATTSPGAVTFASSPSDGTLSTTVVNRRGAVLPETGGIGRTVFYVSGAVLAAVAVILLIRKARGDVSDG